MQKSTGLPIFYLSIHGNIVDVSTLKRIFLHLEALNIDIESCILDAESGRGDRLIRPSHTTVRADPHTAVP